MESSMDSARQMARDNAVLEGDVIQTKEQNFTV
jgi:hypothetical protein